MSCEARKGVCQGFLYAYRVDVGEETNFVAARSIGQAVELVVRGRHAECNGLSRAYRLTDTETENIRIFRYKERVSIATVLAVATRPMFIAKAKGPHEE